MAEQHIADGATADRGGRGDDDDTEQVHAPATGRQGTGHAFGDEADDKEGVKHEESQG